MVTNIGLGDPNATHTTKKADKLYVESEEMKFPLNHPEYILNNKEINNKAVKNNFFSYKRLVRYLLNK